MDETIRELAREAGIANDWVDAAGEPRRVSINSLRGILDALGFPSATPADIADSRARMLKATRETRGFVTATIGTPIALPGLALEKDTAGELTLETGATAPVTIRAKRGQSVVPPANQPGYHRLQVANREITLAVAPPRCLTFGDIAPAAKLWGLAVQLYALRGGDTDFGDAAALRDLVVGAAREGADAIALSPVHSLFAADPSHFGPYSPSSRLFLNPLFAAPSMVFDAARVAAATDQRTAQGTDELIDWPAAARAKYALLRRLFADFASAPVSTRADFESFVRDGGDRLHEHALFEALHQHWFGAEVPAWSWNDWPADWRAPNAPAVVRFAAAEPEAVRFHLFLQWIAARSFAAVQQDARDCMRIGLIADLAIGMNPGGSHAWSRQQDLLLGLSIGAPPDLFNTRGQDWGLTGFSPQALLTRGFEPFIATLRAAMRHAGGVRIDHAMGLARLWLVPHGAAPKDGAYLTYPVDDLMRVLAIESHRHRAVVIAEDLGTVEPAFRRRLARAGIAGMDVLWFQRNGKSFLAPKEWRRDAVAMTTTHDLPTVAGWWQGADIATRHAIGLVADEEREARQRAQDRSALWQAFARSGEVSGDEPPPDNSAPVVDAAVGFAAQSPAPLALIPIEDILGLPEQPNLPGTIDQHPNWRRRLHHPASEVLRAPPAQRRMAILRERRR